MTRYDKSDEKRYATSAATVLAGLALTVLAIALLTGWPGMQPTGYVYGYPYVPVERCYVTPELGR